ncbi:hypothetical protein CANARDRAFT_30023 [[Candida] arabinofermentans NRRL YB-2248]|uniref:DUF726-domain-containing protein n=1 Tax=[Candida] arabinofermentans NRRL YB-2248 TaxID=983967 RepID=A0A1E4SV62_9ASCO|nr:hypothetical protein CANARDRAFT_30023 [[Candida] arabinofermentans NRRL YB-2248]
MSSSNVNSPNIEALRKRDSIISTKLALSSTTDLSIPNADLIHSQYNNNNSSDSDLSDTDDFVEFQLGSKTKDTKINETVTIMNRNLSRVKKDSIMDQLRKSASQEQIIENDESGQRDYNNSTINKLDVVDMNRRLPSKNSSIDDSDDEDWKEMDTQLNYTDIYNIKGDKIQSFIHSSDTITNQNKAQDVDSPVQSSTNLFDTIKWSKKNEQTIHNNNNNNGAGDIEDSATLGYTRIAAEEQATKFNDMDQKFDYLFVNEDSNLRKLHHSNGSRGSGDGSDLQNTTFENDKQQQQQEDQKNIEMNPDSQLATTRSMLQEPQKIAYAALIKLIIVRMHTQLTEIRGSGSISIMKKLAIAQKSYTRWSMNVMNQLYDHLGVKEGKEREMIENLSCHGVETKDLVSWLDINLTISNPLKKQIQTDNDNDNDEEIKVIGVDNENETLEIDVRWTLICDLFLILLESSIYDARSRTLLLSFADAIGIKNLEVYQFERRITDALEMDGTLAMMNNSQTWDEKDILKEHSKKFKKQKYVKIAFATVAGGLVIGLSAGVLAPVIGAGIAAGLTTIGIGGTSGFLAGAASTSIITTTGALAGMRVGSKGMSRRAGSVQTFEFKPLHNTGRVNLILTVSGWMSGKMDDIRLPFSTVDPVMGDLYSLLWEPEMLTSMGQTISILASEVLTQSIQQILGSTVLIALMSAVQLPMMLTKLGYLLDNPWNVSLDRAWSAGLVLADTLRRGKLGIRPITLVGFSLGARLIYSCLLDLAKTGDYGLVENVFLFGSPYVIKADQIAMARSVVGGRYVNGYSKKDWILGYLYRATSGGLSTVAGLSEVEGMENFNCSEYIQGHMEYRKVMPKLLMELGWEVLNEDFIEIEQPDPEQTERQRKLIHDFEEASKQLDKNKKDKNNNKKKKKTWYNKWFSKQNKEWWEMYEEGINEQHEKEGEGEGEGDKSKENESESDSTAKDEDHDDVNTLFDLNQLQKEVENIEVEAANLKEFKLKSPNVSKSENFESIPKTPKVSMNEDEFITDDNITPEQSKGDTDTDIGIGIGIEDGKRKSATNVKRRSASNSLFNISVVQSPTKKETEPQMRSFRITSNSNEGKGTQQQQQQQRSSSFNFNVIQTSNSTSLIPSQASKSDDSSNGAALQPSQASKSDDFSNNAALQPSQASKSDDFSNNAPQPSQASKIAQTKNILNKSIEEKSIPPTVESEERTVNNHDDTYGEDDINMEENIKITYDDEFEMLNDKITKDNESSVSQELDYGDDDEFPTDERNIEITFS